MRLEVKVSFFFGLKLSFTIIDNQQILFSLDFSNFFMIVNDSFPVSPELMKVDEIRVDENSHAGQLSSSFGGGGGSGGESESSLIPHPSPVIIFIRSLKLSHFVPYPCHFLVSLVIPCP